MQPFRNLACLHDLFDKRSHNLLECLIIYLIRQKFTKNETQLKLPFKVKQKHFQKRRFSTYL